MTPDNELIPGRDDLDVLAVMDATASVLQNNLKRHNGKALRSERSGREIHSELEHKQARAKYLIDQHAKAQGLIAQLIADRDNLRAALDACICSEPRQIRNIGVPK